MKYAIFNTEGLPIAFYDDKINKGIIPEDAIQILEQQWKEFIMFQGKRKWNFETNQVEIYEKQFTLEELKQQKIQKLQNITTNYIFQYYSDIKQKSDLSDKEYFETYMKIHNIDEIAFRQAIAQSIQNIYNNTSDFATELSNLQTNFPAPATTTQQEWSFAIEQLFKVAIRVTFVQKCKQVYYQYKQQIQNATTEAELPDLSNIQFPQLVI